MPDVISDTNGKLCVGSYHMWRLLSNPDNYSFVSLSLCTSGTHNTQVYLCTLYQLGRIPDTHLRIPKPNTRSTAQMYNLVDAFTFANANLLKHYHVFCNSHNGKVEAIINNLQPTQLHP